MTRRGPIPPEHREIARGSGAAAILMFLHIAVVGYLAFATYYILRHRYEVIWSLTTPFAALVYWLPVAFALLTVLPSDPLTRKVSHIAQIAGAVAGLTFLGSVFVYYLSGNHKYAATPLVAASALAAGVFGGFLLRLFFAALTVPARENFKKNTQVNELPE